MAIVKPFRAIRPTSDKVALVASRSYDEYDEKELNAALAYNPFSFLHIINPGYKFHKDISGKERFRLVRNRYLEFLEDDIFIREQEPCFYLYQIQKDNFKSLGLFCATSVQDYRKNVIKKHENTIKKRVVLFKDYLKTVGFNAEPVLMTYEDNDEIAKILEKRIKDIPVYDFSSTDKKRHRLWKINDTPTIKKLQTFFENQESLYIADGHHRSASSNLLTEEHEKEGTSHNQHFLSYLIPESNIKIYGFNRMVKDLNGLTPEEFLIRLDEFYRIEERDNEVYKPSKKHHFSMYLEGCFYSLYLRRTAYKFTDELSKIDAQILYKTILEPILGIKDLRNDKRIAYGYGKYNLINLKDNIDKGNYKVGFGMLPITMQEIKAIADADLVMPPKSTYIEPKLRSGLTIFEI